MGFYCLRFNYTAIDICRFDYVAKWADDPLWEDIYLQEAVILCLADICTVFFTEEYSGIMRRGYFQEIQSGIKACIDCI